MQAGVCTHRTQGGAGNPPRRQDKPARRQARRQDWRPHAAASAAASAAAPPSNPAFAQYDLLLKGGHVIDQKTTSTAAAISPSRRQIAEVSAAIRSCACP